MLSLEELRKKLVPARLRRISAAALEPALGAASRGQPVSLIQALLYRPSLGQPLGGSQEQMPREHLGLRYVGVASCLLLEVPLVLESMASSLALDALIQTSGDVKVLILRDE